MEANKPTTVFIACVLQKGDDRIYPIAYCLDPEPTEFLAYEAAAAFLTATISEYMEHGQTEGGESAPSIECVRDTTTSYSSRFPYQMRLELGDGDEYTVEVNAKFWPGQWVSMPKDTGESPWMPAPYIGAPPAVMIPLVFKRTEGRVLWYVEVNTELEWCRFDNTSAPNEAMNHFTCEICRADIIEGWESDEGMHLCAGHAGVKVPAGTLDITFG